jgi:TIR domain
MPITALNLPLNEPLTHCTSGIRDAAPSLLSRADVTSSESLIFISYRRLETLPFALQLFDRLTHEGFEVFLDRFSIPPGFDFQRRLTRELEDKSMVLLLESTGVKDSKWIQHEIDFAKRTRLGFYTCGCRTSIR